MDTHEIINIMFKNEIGVASFHDAIFEACNISHNDAQLLELFYCLPLHIQQTAIEWGLTDTVFNDAVYVYIKKEGDKYG